MDVFIRDHHGYIRGETRLLMTLVNNKWQNAFSVYHAIEKNIH